MLFYVDRDKQEQVRNELSELLLVPFRFENEGTSVIYYVPERYDDREDGND